MSGWIDKAKDFIKGHPEQARDALEKAEDLVNERTGGKYSEQVDQGSDALGDQLGLPPEAEDVPAPAPDPGPAPAPDPGPAPAPDPGPAPVPTPTDAGPSGSDTGTAPGGGTAGGEVPELPSQGDITLGDPPPTRS